MLVQELNIKINVMITVDSLIETLEGKITDYRRTQETAQRVQSYLK